jgi:hypothetical protein
MPSQLFNAPGNYSGGPPIRADSSVAIHGWWLLSGIQMTRDLRRFPGMRMRASHGISIHLTIADEPIHFCLPPPGRNSRRFSWRTLSVLGKRCPAIPSPELMRRGLASSSQREPGSTTSSLTLSLWFEDRGWKLRTKESAIKVLNRAGESRTFACERRRSEIGARYFFF